MMSDIKIRIKTFVLWTVLTMAVITVIIIITALNSKPLENCSSLIYANEPHVILDAGHGGLDGGAVSNGGTEEAALNLFITQKTYDLMKFVGLCPLMTRTDSQSLGFNAEASIRENKNTDLKARLSFAEQHNNCDFISIHLNKFEQSRYFGAQVFYSKNNQGSISLANCLQNTLVSFIDNENTRKAKQSPDNVYLMKSISSPAVTVECGFLSNPEEEKLLIQPEYQTKIAIAITKGYIDYIKER